MSAHAAPGIGASGNLLSRLARLAGFLLAVMDRYRHVMEKWLGGGPGESATPARGWKDIEPRLHAEAYVFVSALEVPPGVQPFAVIREDEATTLVTTRDEADRAGLGYGYVAARITLTINSTCRVPVIGPDQLAAGGLHLIHVPTGTDSPGAALGPVLGAHYLVQHPDLEQEPWLALERDRPILADG